MNATSTRFSDDVVVDGFVLVPALVIKLGITGEQLTDLVGLTQGEQPDRTQRRLRSVVDILDQVVPWAGGISQALAWYKSAPLASFGNRTPAELVKRGHADAVKSHLERITVGGYA